MCRVAIESVAAETVHGWLTRPASKCTGAGSGCRRGDRSRCGLACLARHLRRLASRKNGRARGNGKLVEIATESKDELGRGALNWTQLVVRLPDDGIGALPVCGTLSSTTTSPRPTSWPCSGLCRIADGAAGYVRDADDGHVAVPLGLVGLDIRLFKPLLAAGLPQSPTNQGDAQLGFIKEGFRQLTDVSHLDLRIGMVFGEDRSNALHAALRDACNTITRMPAHYMTYPSGGPVLPVKRIGRVPTPGKNHLDDVYLFSFGELLIPRHLWRALQRFGVWIEPALIAEWSRLMNSYAARQGRNSRKPRSPQR